MHRSEDTGPGSGRGKPKPESGPRRGEPDRPVDACADFGDDAGREPPMRIFTRAQSREVDRRCVEEYGIPSIVLMENAALGIATVVRNLLEQGERAGGGGVLVFAGPGNNGGDGFAAARHLANDQIPVAIVLAIEPERYKGDALTNLSIARRMGLPIFCAAANVDSAVGEAIARIGAPALVLDAILGTGADRSATGIVAELIERINAFRNERVPIVAVDVPSGLDADAGSPLAGPEGRRGPAVRADVTVALLGVKPGYLTLAAQEFVGDCLVAGIGAPRDLVERLGQPLDDRDEPGEDDSGPRRGGHGDAPDPDRPIDGSGGGPGGGAGGGGSGTRGRHRAGRRRPG